MIEGVDIAVRYSIFGYLIGEGFRNVFKNKKSTIASLVIMCATMFVFGIFFAVSQNVNHITKTIEEQQGMEVFILDEATAEQKEELKNKIRSNQYVNTITEKSKEDALEEMKGMFKDRKSLWDTYDGENNPFKASFIVTLTDLTKADEVRTEIESSSIISSVEIKSDTINALIKIADGINIITTIILVILVFISIFIITNTIKLTVHARRKEISGSIKGKLKDVKFVEEYRGNQVPEGKKSIMLRIVIDNGNTTMTSEEINAKMESILKILNKRCGAVLREE